MSDEDKIRRLYSMVKVMLASSERLGSYVESIRWSPDEVNTREWLDGLGERLDQFKRAHDATAKMFHEIGPGQEQESPMPSIGDHGEPEITDQQMRLLRVLADPVSSPLKTNPPRLTLDDQRAIRAADREIQRLHGLIDRLLESKP